ncbi:MAG TPA: hypothetical protein DD429_08720, partial [Clostridiaceae bacterium]|nr:hypothetical protein [Clostridiaceae bacterium]
TGLNYTSLFSEVNCMKEIDIDKTVLSNGLSIVTSTRESDIFSIGVGIRVGSLYEDARHNGVSHIVEHMLFKGTGSRDIDKINDDIESLAGDFDIYTTYNETVLSANIMKSRAEKCIEIISDMLMNSSFLPKEFSMEKKVVVEEIKLEKDDPEDSAYIGLYKRVLPNSWRKLYITGSIKSVKSLNVKYAKEYYDKFYVPGNTVICIVSSYTHKEIVDMITRYFGNWQGAGNQVLHEREKGIFSQKYVSHKKGIGQAHILYGFDISGLSRKEEVALLLLNKKIGSGSNSVLFRELRDKKGYAYNVYSDMDIIKGIRMFYIYAAVSKENIKNTLKAIDIVVDKFASGEIDFKSRSVQLMKDVFLTDTSASMESSAHTVDYLLEGELNYRNPSEYQKVLSIMEGINEDDIKDTAHDVLKNPFVYILSPGGSV